METPNQIGYGLAALVIAVIVSILLANVILPVMPPGAQRFTGALEIGTFLIALWASYLIVIRVVQKRKTRKLSAEHPSQ